ncbi:hypothetical protein [Leptospira interrogans]|uniref:hypothetical protein n=1 Tax=Leptospira interrogans TaxID=173 RepID=UPI0002B952C1|nr:hypothetical protein [Leptospira interrogans]QOI36799.1 hypothetical protein LeptoLang_21675 [Leptospira interrogans serovar Icterohaemorrhagiae]
MNAVPRRVPRPNRPEGSSYAVVDFNVVNGFGLTDGEKIIFSLIHNLSNRKEGCTATNDYFARLLERYNPYEKDSEKLLAEKTKAEKAISASISRLAKKGAITVRLLKTKNGTSRFIFSNVRIIKPTPQNIDPGPQNVEDPPQKVEWGPQNIECMHSTKCGADIKGDNKLDSTKKEKEVSSETITFVNVYEKTKELLASRNIEYVHTVGKETSALNWFLTSGLSADKIIEVVSNLIRIKESKEFKDDLKFWKPIPITIASAKSYYEKIQSTIVALKPPSSERPTQTNHQPDFEYFEDYIQAQKISPTTKQFILSAKSPEEYYDPNSTNPKITYAKSFYETFKKSKQDKGEPCKFKRPAAA